LLCLTVSFPQWPARYTIIGTWKVPYANLSNPITIVHEPGRQYTNQLNGVEQIWNSGPEERVHMKIVGAGDKSVCMTIFPNETFDIELTQFLPSPEGFSLINDSVAYHGIRCELWEKVIDMGKVLTYRMYINKENGNPVAYWVQAISVFNSHYDIYVLEIDEFYREVLPGYWTIPSICDNPIPDPFPGMSFGMFLPKEGSDKVVIERASQKRARGEAIDGRFSHIEKESFDRIIQQKKAARKLREQKRNEANDMPKCFEFKGSSDFVPPKEFSWRTNFSNVLTPPSEQAACGSCWAFSAAGVLESAFALKTGKLQQVSANQIMDCTWDNHNYGCQGGEVDTAFNSLRKNHIGIATEEEYPYLGVSGYCYKSKKPLGYIKDCFKVIPSTKAVKEALYKHGPLGVAINVIEEMSLYTGGVIDSEKCTGTRSDLIHAVLLTGWKIIDGKEVWEIKNSWSSYWGYDGYIYIQSENQEYNCGVTTYAVGVVVSLVDQN
jgi:C1A family cysteine protease